MDRIFPAIHVGGMVKTVIEHLKERLDARLTERGKKATPFAVEIGLKPDVVRDIFRKDAMPSAERLATIADGLDVSIDYLLGRTDDPASATQRKISTDREILDVLERIEGLNQTDVGIAMSVISNARSVNTAAQTHSREHGPRVSETDPHEFQPLRK